MIWTTFLLELILLYHSRQKLNQIQLIRTKYQDGCFRAEWRIYMRMVIDIEITRCVLASIADGYESLL